MQYLKHHRMANGAVQFDASGYFRDGKGSSIGSLVSVLTSGKAEEYKGMKDIVAGVLYDFEAVLHAVQAGAGEPGEDEIESFASLGGGIMNLCAGALTAASDAELKLKREGGRQ